MYLRTDTSRVLRVWLALRAVFWRTRDQSLRELGDYEIKMFLDCQREADLLRQERDQSRSEADGLRAEVIRLETEIRRCKAENTVHEIETEKLLAVCERDRLRVESEQFAFSMKTMKPQG